MLRTNRPSRFGHRPKDGAVRRAGPDTRRHGGGRTGRLRLADGLRRTGRIFAERTRKLDGGAAGRARDPTRAAATAARGSRNRRSFARVACSRGSRGPREPPAPGRPSPAVTNLPRLPRRAGSEPADSIGRAFEAFDGARVRRRERRARVLHGEPLAAEPVRSSRTRRNRGQGLVSPSEGRGGSP